MINGLDLPQPHWLHSETVQSYTVLHFFSWMQFMHLGTVHKYLLGGPDTKTGSLKGGLEKNTTNFTVEV